MTVLAAVLITCALAAANLVLVLRRPEGDSRLLVLAEQALSLQRVEAETTRTGAGHPPI